MNVLALMALVLAQVCYVPSDSSPGWKWVEVPPETPTLAAPEGIEQYRHGEPHEVVDDHPMVFLRGNRPHRGRSEFHFEPGSGACELEIEFAEPLRGAKVSMSAWGPNGQMPLLSEDRLPGKFLRTRWGRDGVQTVELVVHDHLRKEPVIARWKSLCKVVPEPLSSKGNRWLEYRQPAERSVKLCERPGATMRISRAPKGPPREVSLVKLERE